MYVVAAVDHHGILSSHPQSRDLTNIGLCLCAGGGLAVDISLGAVNGAAAVQYVRNMVTAAPPLKVLVLFTKALLKVQAACKISHCSKRHRPKLELKYVSEVELACLRAWAYLQLMPL